MGGGVIFGGLLQEFVATGAGICDNVPTRGQNRVAKGPFFLQMFDGFGKKNYICIGILKLNSNGMKRITRLWMLATCLAMVLGLASCSEEDNPAVSPDETSTEKLADATIIWYGVGGGNTDATILENFRQSF